MVVTDHLRANDLLDVLFEGCLFDVESLEDSVTATSIEASSDTGVIAPESKITAASMNIDAIPGTTPDANKKPICVRFYVPIDNSVTLDQLMNELIDVKKGMDR